MIPNLSDVERPVVGRWYMVPCIRVHSPAITRWMDRDGWVPVMGPKHNDAEHIHFDFDHYHIDWRFIHAQGYRNAVNGATNRSPLAKVLMWDGIGQHEKGISTAPALRRMKCRREMPEFPAFHTIQWSRKDNVAVARGRQNWGRMERAQAFTCNKLKPGNICPHRGISLNQFARPDGTAVCPGHGLHWNLATGELIPRFAGAHTNGGAA